MVDGGNVDPFGPGREEIQAIEAGIGGAEEPPGEELSEVEGIEVSADEIEDEDFHGAEIEDLPEDDLSVEPMGSSGPSLIPTRNIQEPKPEVPDEPQFDRISAPALSGKGEFEHRTVGLEPGMQFLTMRFAPLEGLSKQAKQLIEGGGNHVEASCRPGEPTLIPPHAAQDRPVAVRERGTRTTRQPIRKAFITDDSLLEMASSVEPVRRPAGAVPVPRMIPEPVQGSLSQEAEESRRLDDVPDSTVSPGIEPEDQVLGRKGPPKLRYHPQAPPSATPMAEPPAAPQSARTGLTNRPEPSKGVGEGVQVKKPAPRKGAMIPWWGYALGGAVVVWIAMNVFGKSERPHESDWAGHYAIETRTRALECLDEEIDALEKGLAEVEMDLSRQTRRLGPDPTKEEWITLQRLVRERNSRTIALEAMRQRRRMILGVSHG